MGPFHPRQESHIFNYSFAEYSPSYVPMTGATNELKAYSKAPLEIDS